MAVTSFSTWQGQCNSALKDHFSDLAASEESEGEGTISLSWGFAMCLCAAFFSGCGALNEFCINQESDFVEDVNVA